ncbi:MAG: hypothetical protein RIT28_1542 [Pseudomonadota bacterium]
MRWIAPTVTLLSGAACLYGASHATALAELLVRLALINGEQVVMFGVYLNLFLAIFGLCVLLVGIWLLWQWASDNSEVYEIWVQQLEPVAGEYGRRVEIHPKEGIGFASQADNVRTEVIVQPLGEGYVTVWVASPGRQPLMMMPAHAEGALADDTDWKLVGQHMNWVLRAELPSMARPLLNEGALVSAVSQLMHFPWVKAVRQDSKGVEILMGLMPPEHLSPMVRDALVVARLLVKLNG